MPPSAVRSLREHFDVQLHDLQEMLIRMGIKVEEMIDKAMQALLERDEALARQVVEMDDIVDDMDLSIERRCIHLLATQQPLARDLRLIVSVLKIIADVERMADFAVDIAKKAIRLADLPRVEHFVDLGRMARLVQEMLRDSLRSFVEQDIELAKQVGDKDHQVDRLYAQNIDALLRLMNEHHDYITPGAHLVLVARYIERIGDHITNVVERVHYLVTGQWIELNQ